MTEPVDIRITPHRYQRTEVGTWRTCTICGRGANAEVHRRGAHLPTADEVSERDSTATEAASG